MKKLAILSDTHGLLRPEALAECSAAECIIHAGGYSDFDQLGYCFAKDET